MSVVAGRPGRVSGAWLCIAAMLAVHFLIGLGAARRLSVTHDEYWHLPAGLAAWKTGRFDADDLNPPLTRMWDALPLLLTGARIDPAVPAGDAFRLGDTFMAANRAQYERDLTLARGMNLLFSVATGVLMAVWASVTFGKGAACVAAALWSFCPTALAHGALVTPDMGATCLLLATLLAAWRFSHHPTWRQGLLLGVLLGLAQLTKFTCLLLYPLCVFSWLVIRLRQAGVVPIGWRAAIARCGCVLVLSVAVLNAGYLFRGSFGSLDSYRFRSRAMGAISSALRPVSFLPVPLPRDYLEGLDHQKQIMEGLHPVYLDGVWSEHGFADYYVWVLFYKLPHAVQALCILSLLFLLAPAGLGQTWRVQALLWAPVLAIFASASAIGMQLGIRYILPAFPLAYLAAAQAARWLDWKRFRFRTLLILPLVVLLPCSLRFHPEHLAYFNELAGGPLGGRNHLLDSNLDWGQDLGALGRFLEQEQLGKIGLAYFGMAPPAEFGIEYRLPSDQPLPGWYAVSVNFARGYPHTIRNPDGTMRSADLNEFAYFQNFVPVARIGASIDVYHLEGR